MIFKSSVHLVKIVSVQTSVYVCVSTLKAIVVNGGMMWCNYAVIWTTGIWLNQFYSSYMATVVIIINGRGLGIVTYCTH